MTLAVARRLGAAPNMKFMLKPDPRKYELPPRLRYFLNKQISWFIRTTRISRMSCVHHISKSHSFQVRVHISRLPPILKHREELKLPGEAENL